MPNTYVHLRILILLIIIRDFQRNDDTVKEGIFTDTGY
jgi:hypothetical protein